MTKRNEAKYFQGNPCYKGHDGTRYISTGVCVTCHRAKCSSESSRLYHKNRYYNDPKRKPYLKGLARSHSRTIRGKAMAILAKAKGRRGLNTENCVDLEWVEERLSRGLCELSGLPLEFGRGKRGPYSPSIDRIDSALGYSKDNCRIVLWSLNAAFGNWGSAEFKIIADAWLRRKIKS